MSVPANDIVVFERSLQEWSTWRLRLLPLSQLTSSLDVFKGDGDIRLFFWLRVSTAVEKVIEFFVVALSKAILPRARRACAGQFHELIFVSRYIDNINRYRLVNLVLLFAMADRYNKANENLPIDERVTVMIDRCFLRLKAMIDWPQVEKMRKHILSIAAITHEKRPGSLPKSCVRCVSTPSDVFISCRSAHRHCFRCMLSLLSLRRWCSLCWNSNEAVDTDDAFVVDPMLEEFAEYVMVAVDERPAATHVAAALQAHVPDNVWLQHHPRQHPGQGQQRLLQIGQLEHQLQAAGQQQYHQQQQEHRERPGGSSCHQCKNHKKKYQLLYCTNILDTDPIIADSPLLLRRCQKKYCTRCLIRYYDRVEEPLNWICPACGGICDCASCKKKREKDARQKEREILASVGLGDLVPKDLFRPMPIVPGSPLPSTPPSLHPSVFMLDNRPDDLQLAVDNRPDDIQLATVADDEHRQ